MNIFLYGPANVRTQQLAHRLTYAGYTSTTITQARFAGKPTERQVRRRMLKDMLEADAVVVADDAATPEELARLLVVCEFACRPLVLAADLPDPAPEDPCLLPAVPMEPRVFMAPLTPAVGESRMRRRVRFLVQRAYEVWDHGRWLKNPNSRRAQGI